MRCGNPPVLKGIWHRVGRSWDFCLLPPPRQQLGDRGASWAPACSVPRMEAGSSEVSALSLPQPHCQHRELTSTQLNSDIN